MRLFVGNLASNVSDEELKTLFEGYGLRKAEVVRGRGGRGRGFGYVELANDADAARAVSELQGREIRGRTVTLAEARSTPRRPPAEEDRYGAPRHGPGGSGRRDRREGR